MSTNAQVAAELLRHVATFLREVGTQNPAVADKMAANAKTYDQVADLIQNDPEGGLTAPTDGTA